MMVINIQHLTFASGCNSILAIRWWEKTRYWGRVNIFLVFSSAFILQL